MASLTTLLVIGFLATANAAPTSDLPKCAHECPPAGSQKLHYAPDKTYSYAYSGKSEIHMRDVEGGISQMEWNSQVDLTWISPCDMAITFRNPSFGGASGIPEANFLARYPLVVAITDGRVQHVCSHPDDDTWAINLKKGVASAFQNTLPSNSSVNSGLNFTETDVAGKCPTTYEVKNEGDKVIIEKVKNHRFCQERFPSQAETPMSWIKAPLPLEESWSKCKQELSQGIYSSIVCEDKNIIKPAIGSYKYVEAKQTSKLQYQSESSNVPQAVASLRGQLYKRSLRYDHETLKRDPAKVPELEQTLKQVCEKTKQKVEKEAAALVDKAIHLMRRVPESAIEQLLQKVKSGEICSERQKMESLFLDAVAFVQEANTVKLMVREILSGQTSGGRAALYTVALYFTPRPSLQAVEAVKPLLEQSQRFPMASLAAATMVNTYCKHHPHCQQEAPVRQAAEALSRNAQQQCSSAESQDAEKACLAALKSLGNMGVMTSEIARNIISIIEKEEVKTAIRVVAAQTFRNVPCQREEREATRQLVKVAVNPSKETETRIASYLAAAKCAEVEDFREIADKIAKEDNTQVRGFILSHLLNLRESSAPHKERLRYILSSISIPSNFSADARKYSRNIDLSYYAPSFGVGAGVESNVIYTPRSFIPRSVNFNISSAMGATQVNLGEFGARIEGMEPAVEEVFGPEGYFQKSSMKKIISDLSQFAEEKGANIFEHIVGLLRERRSIDLSSLSHFFSKIYGERSMKEPRADVFARFNGQEVAYASLTKKMMEGVNTDELIDKFFDYLEETMHKAAHLNVDTARAFQAAVDYSLPTIQGVPLKMKMNGTAVVGLKLETRLNDLESSSPSIAKIKPSLSSELAGFIGFDTFLASCGVRTQTSISSKNDVSINIKGGRRFEIELDIPEKMEIIDAQSQTYLVKAVKGQPETKITPSGVRTTPVQSQGCFRKLEEATGLKVCYDVNVPNIFRSEGLPLYQPAFAKLTAEKAESSMKGWKAKGEMQNSESRKELKVQMETEGSSTPRKAEALLKYSAEGESVDMVAAVSSQSSGGLKAELKTKNSESEKMLQIAAYKSNNQNFSPETQVLEVQLSSHYNGQTSQMQILTRTKNALRHHIEHDFEVQADVGYTRAGVPYPRRLEKFNFKTAAGNYRLESSVEKKSESEYSSQIRIGSRSSDKYAITATHTVEGSVEEGFSLKTAAKAKVHDAHYKAAFDVHNNHEKIGTALQVIKQQDSSKLVEFETLVSKSGSSYNAKFLLASPRYMNPIKFESKVDDQGSHRYQLQMALKHGGKVLLQADGPVTAKYTPAIKQIQADLRVRTSETEPLRLSAALILAKNKQLVSCEIKDQTQQLLDLEWNLSAKSEETQTQFRLMLPNIIDNKINAIVSRKNVHVSFNNLVSPKSSSSRRWKGFTDVDFESKNAKAEVSWNADKDPSQKLSVEGTFASSPASPRQTTVHGSWTFIGSTYRYKTDVRCSNPESWIWGQKNVKIAVSSPEQKTYTVDTNMDIQKQSSGARVNAQVQYKNPESKIYKVHCDASVEQLGRPYNFRASAKTDLTVPEAGQSSINLEAKYEHTSPQREAYIEIQVSNPKLSKPVQTSFSLKHQQTSYSAHWSINVDSPANGAAYDVKLSPEGAVQFCKVEFDAKEIAKLAKAAGKLAGVESGSSSSSHGSKYLVQYEKPSHASHKLSIHSPSRKMEGEAKYSPEEYSVKFYPNKERRESKYAASLTRSGTSGPWEEEIKYKGRFEHPSSARPREIEIAYSRNEGKIQGSATLDIFARAEDKISASLESAVVAKNSVRVEAKLSGKVLKANPKVIVTGSYASHTVAFDLIFEKSPSSRPSLVISGKYDRSTGRNAAMALTVKNEERPVLEISGSIRAEQEPDCNGLKIVAAARSSAIGSYDISSKLCKAGFAKAFVKNQNSNVGYTARAGLKSVKILELSVSENDVRQQEEKHIAMARVVLASPKIVNVEGKWASEKASSLSEAASEKLSTVSSSLKSWLETMEQEVLQQSGSGSPANEIHRLLQEAKEEIQRIYDDLVNDNLIPSWDALERRGVGQFVRKTASSYKQLWFQIDELKRKVYQSVPSTVRSLKEQFQGLTKAVNTAVVGSARWMKTGEMPEEIRDVVEKITSSQLWQDVKTFVNDVKNFLMAEEMATSEEVIQKYREILIKDLEKIRYDLMMNYKVQQNVDWIIEHLNFERLVTQGVERVFNKIIQSSLLSSAQIRGDHIQIQLPLQQPASSLAEAWKYLLANPIPVPDNALRMYESITLRPVDSLVWYYYTLLPQRVTDLLPPYNRTAVLVDGSEILTFDGTLLRAPHSPCKVLLAQYKSTSLTMEHPRSPKPQVTLKAYGVTVVVKPDGKVMANGREVSAPEQAEGEVTIYKTQDEIKIRSPYMTVRVYPRNNVVSVEVSGWAFGQVAGLLGTYDGERANDWATLQGSHASSLQELVRSWQEDPHCQTPPVSFKSASEIPPLRPMQCQALLGIRSRCNAVVRPEAFIKMCYSSQNPCDVAKAYRDVCSGKGLEAVFPLTC